MKKKIVDTNILMNYPSIVKEDNIVIATDILKELDGLKLNINPETAFQARRAAIYISRHLDNIEFNKDYEKRTIPVDDKLLLLTSDYSKYGAEATLITNDVYLKVRATAENISTEGYQEQSEYTGIYYWTIEVDSSMYNKDFETFLDTKRPLDFMNLKENQYIIVKSTNGDSLGIYQWRGGEIRQVEIKPIKNAWINKITPRNDEQICLVDALYNKSATVLYAGGPFGAGKSILTNSYALQQLEKGDIRKIVFIPNNAYVRNSMEIGLLPGTSLDKTLPLVGPLLDIVGTDQINQLISMDQLEIIPMAYLRGRNFDDTIIIVNEAQNLDSDHIKLLIGRVGNNSRIFFDGSQKQVDSELFKNKSGIRALLNIVDSPYKDLFTTVTLKDIERSRTAQIADFLDLLDDSEIFRADSDGIDENSSIDGTS